MWILVRLSGYSSAIALVKEQNSYGNHYLHFTDSAPSVTPIFGQLTSRYCLVNGIELWARKQAGTTCIERFNNTLRQRVGRLVRKTLSFSKKLSNHIGAVWYFIHYYNASLRL
jgi:hypothetical protein